MRIVSGTHKGRPIKVNTQLTVRPTTDMAKVALFNILNSYKYIDELKVLDLFAGTGSISYEFASRGSKSITAIDNDHKCVDFIVESGKHFGFNSIIALYSDAFDFLNKTNQKYDLIFADPPYTAEFIESIPEVVFKNDLLKEEGWLVIEHPREIDFKDNPNFYQNRKYGKVNFTIFI